MTMRWSQSIQALVFLALSACAGGDDSSTADVPVTLEAMQPALSSITAEDLLRHTSALADDSMEGRAPGGVGEERAIRYLEGQFRALGLAPGNPDGSYVQKVPLVGMTPVIEASLNVKGKPMPLRGQTDYTARTRHVKPEVKVENSDVVFVGYGVVAPEFGWDDYKDVNVRGKTIVMLVNDPPIRMAGDTSKLDDSMFRGRAMTYYGRWTYKYEIAAQKGAAAAIIVHETGPAGYPFEVLNARFGQEDFDINSPDNNNAVAVQAWISEPAARKFLAQAGQNFDQLKAAALTKEFRPVDLGTKANFNIRNTIREIDSNNVVAKLEGGKHPDEYIIYSAHWDHLGKNEAMQGDNIYNGALDNASGTAALLEIAEAFTKLGTKPDRSILFLAVTAEERGLLGAKYYAENPVYPLANTVANINMDGVNQWGRTSDLTVIGLGNSTLDDVLADAAATQNRTLNPDAEPEKGFYYRSDHFEFAKQGVPALYTDAGTSFVGKDSTYGQTKRDEYTNNDYHKVTDQVKPDWDLSGAVEDVQLLFQVGYRVSQRGAFPEWKPGTEFKAKRDSMIAGKAK
jgi:Zn-dependent M28 family amino/carboxypeptidase